jgi:hypothetical protein
MGSHLGRGLHTKSQNSPFSEPYHTNIGCSSRIFYYIHPPQGLNEIGIYIDATLVYLSAAGKVGLFQKASVI